MNPSPHSNLVRKYLSVFKVPSFYPGDKDDLLQVGLLGLLRAEETYDSTKSAFETWAWYWIRSYIRNEIRRFKYLHIPVTDVYNISTTYDFRIALKQVAHDLDNKSLDLLTRYLAGQNPTEIGREWGVSRQAIDQRLDKVLTKLRRKHEGRDDKGRRVLLNTTNKT